MRQLKIAYSITNRDAKSLDTYLYEIGKISMVNNVEEESTLAMQIRQGDHVALERLVKANLRFVVSVAKQYQNQGLGLSDLLNEGNLGLIKAAKRFDETKGFKFISYAVWWIRQSIMKAIVEESRTIRLPFNQVGALSKISKASSRLEQYLEREPSVEELSEVLDMTPEKITEALYHGRRLVSLDRPLLQGEGESDTLLDITGNGENSPDQPLMDESVRKKIIGLLSVLSKIERDVIVSFYGLEAPAESIENIAQRHFLTRERVRQIREKALKKLRKVTTSHRMNF